MVALGAAVRLHDVARVPVVGLAERVGLLGQAPAPRVPRVRGGAAGRGQVDDDRARVPDLEEVVLPLLALGRGDDGGEVAV